MSDKLRWAFFVDGMEFDGETIRTKALGGSETAGYYVARELAARGHEVTLFCKCPQEGVWNGVRYRHVRFFQEWVGSEAHDVTVVQRVPGPFTIRLASPVHLWWMHDLALRRFMDPIRGVLWNVDKILTVSEWMRQQYLTVYGLDPAVVHATRNGIDLDLIRSVDGPPARERLLVFTARPERGMDIFLGDVLPRIIKQVPDVGVALAGYENYVQELAPLYQRIQQLVAQYGGRVRHLGGLAKPDLYRLYKRAALYCYPTDFEEVSCCVGSTLVDMPRDYLKHPRGVPIKDLVGKKDFPVYCYDEKQKRITLGTVKWVKKTRRNAPIWRLALDDGSVLKATPDHLIMRRDGTYCRLDELKPGDSLMPLYKKPYVSVVRNDGTEIAEHRLVAEWKGGRISTATENADHISGNNWNNSPENIQLLTRSEHTRKTFAGRQRHPGFSEKCRQAQLARVVQTSAETYSERGRNRSKKLWDGMTPEERIAFCKRRADARRKKFNGQYNPPQTKAAAKKWWDGLDPAVRQEFVDHRAAAVHAGRWNHTVVSVRPAGRADVYDMEVEKFHNFVASGIVIHNCITAMECAACGLPFVASHRAALPETCIPEASLLVPHDEKRQGARHPDFQQRFADEVVALLRDEKRRAAMEAAGLAGAERYRWSGVAAEWEALAESLMPALVRYE